MFSSVWSRMLGLALALAVIGVAVYLLFARGEDQSAAAVVLSLESGLIGHWEFDDPENPVADSSGNVNDGQIFGTEQIPGRDGLAQQFGADDSHISIPASPSLNDFTDQITVSAWVMPKTPPNGFRVVVSRQIETLGHPDQFYLGFGEWDGVTHYKWHLGTKRWLKTRDRAIYTGAPAANRWLHMAGVYDGKTMRLYVDGQEIGSKPQTGRIRVDDNPVTIGGEENGPEPHIVSGEFDGLIDDVRIYNRALSAAEIAKIYRLPAP